MLKKFDFLCSKIKYIYIYISSSIKHFFLIPITFKVVLFLFDINVIKLLSFIIYILFIENILPKVLFVSFAFRNNIVNMSILSGLSEVFVNRSARLFFFLIFYFFLDHNVCTCFANLNNLLIIKTIH